MDLQILLMTLWFSAANREKEGLFKTVFAIISDADKHLVEIVIRVKRSEEEKNHMESYLKVYTDKLS